MAKEVHKLQQLNEGDSNPHIQELKAHHNELVVAHNNLVEQFNTNFDNFNKICQQLDVRLGAAYSAMQDLVDSLEGVGAGYTSCVHTVSAGASIEAKSARRIDWPKYIQQHIDTLQVELARIKAEKEALENTGAIEQLAGQLDQQESPLITPEVTEEAAEEDEPATVFGGDHAQAQP